MSCNFLSCLQDRFESTLILHNGHSFLLYFLYKFLLFNIFFYAKFAKFMQALFNITRLSVNFHTNRTSENFFDNI